MSVYYIDTLITRIKRLTWKTIEIALRFRVNDKLSVINYFHNANASLPGYLTSLSILSSAVKFYDSAFLL